MGNLVLSEKMTLEPKHRVGGGGEGEGDGRGKSGGQGEGDGRVKGGVCTKLLRKLLRLPKLKASNL